MSITLQFLGAAETVTGSKFLLTVDKRRYLVDCGLFQGGRELREMNWEPFPIPPKEIDAVLLTHAHLDHAGYLPRLWKQGFRGSVHCTAATAEIARLALLDSGKLQEEFAKYANKKGFSRHARALPLYTEKDAKEACKLLAPAKFNVQRPLDKCTFRFLIAGHILGSAFIELWLPNGEKILFGGDLGRPDQPIIRDPACVDAADYLLIESTYGNRKHPDTRPTEALGRLINESMSNRGVIIIPAFAIGRTQDVLFYLNELEQSGKCEPIPIYVDSPMGIDATDIYARHHEDHDLQMEQYEREGRSPLRSRNVNFVHTVSQSKALNQMRGPAIIIASSGMAAGGRVVHHLAARLPNPEDRVLFVGYQAEGTLGRALIEGTNPVRIMGQAIEVRASIDSIGSLSAHADADEIMAWLKRFRVKPKNTFIVHGEPAAQSALRDRITTELDWETCIPKLKETITLAE